MFPMAHVEINVILAKFSTQFELEFENVFFLTIER